MELTLDLISGIRRKRVRIVWAYRQAARHASVSHQRGIAGDLYHGEDNPPRVAWVKQANLTPLWYAFGEPTSIPCLHNRTYRL